ncbi:hypothetical protein P355_1389 [Burkholderia cenocepacia KC-01]|nr:hypothetical protein P355_1389 [Burkholderia cenocepacia KC-01]
MFVIHRVLSGRRRGGPENRTAGLRVGVRVTGRGGPARSGAPPIRGKRAVRTANAAR